MDTQHDMDVKHDYTAFGETPDTARLDTPDITRMAQSAVDFLTRFSATPSVKVAVDRAGSEVFEWIIAMSDAQLARHPDEKAMTRELAAKEAADVMYAVASACTRVGITPQMLQAAFESVIKKNDAKTLKTHHVTPNGSIEKNVKVAK